MPKSDKNPNGRHEAAFASWIRRNGYAPSEAIEHFLEHSDYIRDEFTLLDVDAKTAATAELRKFLQRRSGEDSFTMQFPTVYLCKDKQGRRLRYTVTLTIGEDEATWIGRVWAGSEYLGEVTGSGGGPKANYLTLARMHIESQIDCHDAIVKRPLPDFW
ncbi:hypothetical protein SAMN05428989_1453 [Pseudoxanthomonas sp. GM95]|uniref:hypothetical protein n=1 Tax=Pseudoxanthomonas sp. GM95 TaxID=1881043 RepID=UPI0008B40134|nr:hypothetical protein [Pseudoxanthomonas sp. GM95]SEL10777.1 hypothetical protein SAMN05428989_1453 [Pseudoxanthomonas sp. GM95]